MTPEDNNVPDRGSDDMLAAEYVVGVLDADEWQVVSRRVGTDPAFARLVDEWELRLSPLAGDYVAVETPATLKGEIDRRLFASGRARAEGQSIWSSLALWRTLTAGALAAFLVAVAIPFVTPPVPTDEARFVASLTADASDVKYLAVYDDNDDQVSLAHVSGEKASDRDFELWMIEGDAAPVSMGVLPAGETIKVTITPETRAKLAAGAVLAISLEPAGGSPTGQPTGPVVAAGDLKSI
jgi:anti-sigma-K factor RskA